MAGKKDFFTQSIATPNKELDDNLIRTVKKKYNMRED